MKYIKKIEQYEDDIDKSTIYTLDLCNKNLTELSCLSEYTNLIRLHCSFNQLTSLPELPSSLEYLDCDYNKLTSLPKLPDSLEALFCYENQLPFDDLIGYNKWYNENIKIIDKEGLEYAYQLTQNINKYNL